MPFCPSCKREYTAAVKFCPDCGSAVVAELSIPATGVHAASTATAPEQTDAAASITALARRVTGIHSPETIGIGYWGVVDRQTVAKDMGQAFLSGALGMAAPFLVKGSDYAGHVGLVAGDGAELVFVDFGIAPLEGVDKDALSLGADHFQSLLRSEIEPPVKKVPYNKVTAAYHDNHLSITGELAFGMRMLASGAASSAQTIAYAVNGISRFMNPSGLIDQLLAGGVDPRNPELARMAAHAAYMDELFALLEKKRRGEQSRVFQLVKGSSSGFASAFADFLRRKSEGSQKRPKGSYAAIAIGLVILAVVAYRFISFYRYEQQFTSIGLTPPERHSGLPEIGAGLVGIILVFGGVVTFLEYRRECWYRRQLDVYLQHDPTTARDS